MFSGCTSLALCQPGSSCRNIGQYAFSGCSSLQAFKVPNSMSEIPEGFFNGCTSLAICDFDSFTGSMLQKVSNFAFSGCSNLQSLTLPTSINSISKISNLAFSGSSLTQITFKGLNDSVFEGGSADTGRRYSTGRLYSNTAEGYSVIDEALETNTPVVVIIGNSAHNGAKGSGVFQMIAYSSAFTGAIAMKPYYFVYIDK